MMKVKIKRFNDFITEKLGILESIGDIADTILNGLSENKYFKFKGKYLDKNITIHCFLTKLRKENLQGSFSVDDVDNFEFTIKISELKRPTLIHELKHMDRAIRRSMKTDTYFYINHIGRYVAQNYSNLFRNKDSAKILIETFYFCNPDEFEAYFQNIYEEIKEIIEENMSREEKISIIKQHLENEEIYQFFKHYYNNSFKLEEFFKSKEDCNFFLKEFFFYHEAFFHEINTGISTFDKIKSWFKSNFFNKIFKDESTDKSFKEFNYYINKIVHNNYKKFGRLYSLLAL
jgi:hypothetical protein